MVDTFRGALRVRSWPKKRGPRGTPRQELWKRWFADANRLAIRGDAGQMALAIRAAKGTGLYPRDILIKAMGTGFFDAIDEDGNFITKRWHFLEPVMYQGVSLNLVANQAIAAGTNTAVQWGLPQIDTAGFWNAGAPTLITIPTGVEWIGFQASYACTASVAGSWFLWVERVAPSSLIIVQAGGPDGYTNGIVAAPFPVVAGETYRVMVFFSSARTLILGPKTSFSATILQAA
jgi:hypothetical protein